MTIVKARLNDNDKEFLKKIFLYGGYTTCISSNNYRQCTVQGMRYILDKLCHTGYLKAIPFYSDSRRDAMVYQVTAKTCKLFDNADSYFRKKHNDVYVIRALAKQHFLFEICHDFKEFIVADHEKRLILMLEDIGVNSKFLPTKTNKDTSFIHIEECIIDARNCQDKELYCKLTGEKLMSFTAPKIVIVHADKYQINAASQLLSLTDRYKEVIGQGLVDVGFIIAVDCEEREISYKKAIYKMNQIYNVKPDKTIVVHKNIIWLHMKLLQNFLITGTIGTGKTASGMYPFTKQAMFYKASDPDLKPGILFLDVKGNFYKQVIKFAEEAGRLDDVIIIELGGKYKYNPVHKPNMRPLVLANRSKTVLSLFSPKGNSDSYWLDKGELLIAECIKLCRLYNNGYVTFCEINKLVNNKAYLDMTVSQLIEERQGGTLTDDEEEEFETALNFFENEYANLSENTLSIIQSVVTQMTQLFYTDREIRDTFSPSIEQLNFHGFEDVSKISLTTYGGHMA